MFIRKHHLNYLMPPFKGMIKAQVALRYRLSKKITQYRQLLYHVVRIGADTASPVRVRSEQQINNCRYGSLSI